MKPVGGAKIPWSASCRILATTTGFITRWTPKNQTLTLIFTHYFFYNFCAQFVVVMWSLCKLRSLAHRGSTVGKLPLLGDGAFLSVAWPIGFNCWFSFAPVFQWCCSTPQESPGVGRNTLFLSSPHLCFITIFICDLFVSCDDPLMS